MGADAQQLEAFVRQFVLPLVAGGEIHVNRPLDADDMESLVAYVALRDEPVLAVEATCRQLAAQLWLFPVLPTLNPTALRLVVAAYNLLFLSHPVSAKWRVGKRGRGRIERFIRACLELPPPADDGELVIRHTLLGNLVRVTRSDTEIRFWLGRRTFVGSEPPERLLRWRQLRRVREERHTTGWLATELSEDQHQLLGLLFAQSPLTDLLTPDRPAPPFAWLPLQRHLGSRWLCRLVCHDYLQRGLSVVGPSLAVAFWQLVADQQADQARRAAALQSVCKLVAYLMSLHYLTRDPTAEDAQQIRSDAPEATLESVLVAGARCGLAPPPGSLTDTEVEARIQQWIASSQHSLGQAADQLTSQLQAALA